jgi:ElaB/YqjD/DUF883 family membrane-anchored ribosome-binding protein
LPHPAFQSPSSQREWSGTVQTFAAAARNRSGGLFSAIVPKEDSMKQQSLGADSPGNGTAADTDQSGVAREYHAFVSDVEDLISSATSLTGADLARAKARLSARITSARASIARAGGAVSEQARSGARATDSYLRAQPWQAVGITAAAGFLIGYLLGRRGS